MKAAKVFPISLLIWPYLIAPLFMNIFESGFGSVYFITYTLLTPIIVLASILFSCIYRKDHAAYDLAFWNLVIKLVHIPFYLVVFVFGIGVMIAIPLLFIIDALLMLTSSAYGISTLVRAYKQDRISLEFLVINIVCHLLFCLDVVSAIIVYRKMRKVKPKETMKLPPRY